MDKTIANEVDPNLPLILTAHASIGGATYGSERMVMLGQDLVLGKGLVADPRFDYVALGHIHKHQSLNENPPVVYSGSIERIDFGEWREAKGFVLAEVERGKTSWRFVKIETRPFYDQLIRLDEADGFMDRLMGQFRMSIALPAQSVACGWNIPTNSTRSSTKSPFASTSPARSICVSSRTAPVANSPRWDACCRRIAWPIRIVAAVLARQK